MTSSPYETTSGARTRGPDVRASHSSSYFPGVRPASAVGVLGVLIFFADLSLRVFGQLDRSYYVIATAMAVAMSGLPLVTWFSGSIRRGWPRALGVAASGLNVVGGLAWVTAFVLLFRDPAEALSERLIPSGSLLMSLGMLLVGVPALASYRGSRSGRWLPLLVGVSVPSSSSFRSPSFSTARTQAQVRTAQFLDSEVGCGPLPLVPVASSVGRRS